MIKRKVPIILGPTSSGKTSMALRVCKELGWQILSADSRQVYKQLDIGTGKLPVTQEHLVKKGNKKWQIDGVDLWGYDLVEWGAHFSAYDYAEFGLTVLKANENTIVAGGTGFYIDVLTGNLKLDGSTIDPSLRSELENLSLEELQSQVDLDQFNESDINNKQRLIRYIEKEKNVGTSQPLQLLENVEFTYIGLVAEREVLYARVDEWVDEIWDSVQKEAHDLNLKTGLVYKTAYEGDKQQTKYDLHAYIRRQQTYFKKMDRQVDIHWVELGPNTYGKVLDFLA